jgi:hypothetical protein
MSTFIDVDVPCDLCGMITERTVATSINATRAPEYRQAILDGTFQRFRCSGCGAESTPLVPFIYLDFDRGNYIGVFPSSDEATWWAVEEEPLAAFDRNLGAQAPPPARGIGSHFQVRTVFGLTALREKIVVLEAGLDDAVLEALKLRLMAVMSGLSLDLAGRPRLVAVTADQLVFLVAQASADDHRQLEVPRTEYEDIAADEVLRAGFVRRLEAGPYRDAGRLLRPAPTIAVTD